MTVRILHGDALEQLRTLADESVHSICTDPPYELGFMGKAWDGTGIANSVALWTECLRVLKPGGHLLSFGGSRTYHRMACAIEDAGFEIRDQIMWIYGSGFPKSLDVSKAIDKARDDSAAIKRVTAFIADGRNRSGLANGDIDGAFAFNGMSGHWTTQASQAAVPRWEQWLRLKALLSLTDEMDAEVWRLNGRKGTPGEAWDQREVIGRRTDGAGNGSIIGLGSARVMATEYDETAPATESARQWQGWGTALKPAHEPIVVARKPLIGTVAANVLAHGTGAINVDGCRIEGGARSLIVGENDARKFSGDFKQGSRAEGETTLGRWPANLIHDGSDEVIALFPADAGAFAPVLGTEPSAKTDDVFGVFGGRAPSNQVDGGGSAARFFYTAKASAEERNIGCEGLPQKQGGTLAGGEFVSEGRTASKNGTTERGNHHPTVKPTDLMQYLVRLVTPPGGTVLDPFAGSGSTGLAADREGFDAILIEREAEYVEIARRRIVGDCPLFAELAA